MSIKKHLLFPMIIILLISIPDVISGKIQELSQIEFMTLYGIIILVFKGDKS